MPKIWVTHRVFSPVDDSIAVDACYVPSSLVKLDESMERDVDQSHCRDPHVSVRHIHLKKRIFDKDEPMHVLHACLMTHHETFGDEESGRSKESCEALADDGEQVE